MKAVQIGAILACACSAPICAQTFFKPPEFQQVDKNGVDLLSGQAALSIQVGSVGSDLGQLAYSEHWQSGGRRDSLYSDLYRYRDDNNLQIYVVLSIENGSKRFVRLSNGSYLVERGAHESLTESSDGRLFTYTRKDGQQEIFGIPPAETNLGSGSGGYCTSNSASSPWAQCGLVQLRRNSPNGVTWTYDWDSYGGFYARPKSVISNLGYKITLSYLLNATPNLNNYRTWAFVTGIQFHNIAQSASPIYSGSRSLMQIVIPGSGGYYTEASTLTTVGGEVWNISSSTEGGPSAFKTPSSNTVNWSFPGASPTFSPPTVNLTVNGTTYGYRFQLSGVNGQTKVTDPNGAVTQVNYTKYSSKVSSAAFPNSIIDPLGKTTSFNTVKSYLITDVTRPEGNKEIYGYDSRDNITSVTYRSKPGSGLPDLTETAEYPTSCSNSLTCNRPSIVRDKKGNVTEYTYSADHGGILTETSSPDMNGIRPVVRSSYAQRYAWVGDGVGGYVRAASPVWLKSEERACRTTATIGSACAGGSGDEVVTMFDYGPDSGPNNLNLRGVVAIADGISNRTCYRYDLAGRKVSETKPLGTGSVCP